MRRIALVLMLSAACSNDASSGSTAPVSEAETPSAEHAPTPPAASEQAISPEHLAAVELRVMKMT